MLMLQAVDVLSKKELTFYVAAGIVIAFIAFEKVFRLLSDFGVIPKRAGVVRTNGGASGERSVELWEVRIAEIVARQVEPMVQAVATLTQNVSKQTPVLYEIRDAIRAQTAEQTEQRIAKKVADQIAERA